MGEQISGKFTDFIRKKQRTPLASFLYSLEYVK